MSARAKLAQVSCALLIGAIWGALPATAGSIALPDAGFGGIAVSVESVQEAKFRSIVRQQYDFSCGSAAVATLLSHHYSHPVREDEVFRAMYEGGDQGKIRRQGFSLLDIKRYLAAAGFDSDGFQTTLAALAKERIPSLALLQKDGFRHFVVIKGIDARDVLVGDPSVGTTVIDRGRFESMWNGVAFLIRDHADVARTTFGRKAEWRARRKAPIREALDAHANPQLALVLPERSDF